MASKVDNFRHHLSTKLAELGFPVSRISKIVRVDENVVKGWVEKGEKPDPYDSRYEYIERMEVKLEKIKKSLTKKHLDYFLYKALVRRSVSDEKIGKRLGVRIKTVAKWKDGAPGALKGMNESFVDWEVVDQALGEKFPEFKEEPDQKAVNYFWCWRLRRHGMGSVSMSDIIGPSKDSLEPYISRGVVTPSARRACPSEVRAILDEKMVDVRKNLTEENIKYFLAKELRRHGVGYYNISIAVGIKDGDGLIKKWLMLGRRPSTAKETLEDQELVYEELKEVKRKITEGSININYFSAMKLKADGYDHLKTAKFLNLNRSSVGNWFDGIIPRITPHSLMDWPRLNELVRERLENVERRHHIKIKRKKATVEQFYPSKAVIDMLRKFPKKAPLLVEVRKVVRLLSLLSEKGLSRKELESRRIIKNVLKVRKKKLWEYMELLMGGKFIEEVEGEGSEPKYHTTKFGMAKTESMEKDIRYIQKRKAYEQGMLIKMLACKWKLSIDGSIPSRSAIVDLYASQNNVDVREVNLYDYPVAHHFLESGGEDPDYLGIILACLMFPGTSMEKYAVWYYRKDYS